MGLNGINFVVGIITGIVMTSIIWGVVISLRIKRNKKSKEESNEIIGSIAELLADIENASRLHNSGRVKRNEFKKTFESKYETINRELKANMHLLDIYFVKYVELFLNIQSKIDSDKVASPKISTDEKEDLDKTATKLIISGEVEQFDDKSFTEQNVDEVESVNIDFMPGKEKQNDSAKDEKNTDLSKDSFSEKEETNQSQLQKKNNASDEFIKKLPDTESSESESKQYAVVEDEDVDSFEANIPEEFIAGNNTLNDKHNRKEIDQQSISKQENVFEDKNDFDKASEEISVEEFQQGFDQDERIEGSENEADFEIKSDQSEILSNSNGEDFSMETIMDYDMSNIKNIASGDSDLDLEQITTSADSSDISRFSRDLNEDEILCETIQIEPSNDDNTIIQDEKIIDEKKISESRNNTEEIKGDNSSSTLEINSSLHRNKEESKGSKEQDVAITGDDVANKIDSFFGFKS